MKTLFTIALLSFSQLVLASRYDDAYDGGISDFILWIPVVSYFYFDYKYGKIGGFLGGGLGLLFVVLFPGLAMLLLIGAIVIVFIYDKLT